jgi:hypothetical protein
MISIFVETQSFSAVCYLCCELWLSCGSTEKFLTRPVVKSILLPYLFATAHFACLKSKLTAIALNSSSLSCDHTYKYVKYFNVTDPENKRKRVHI